MRTIQVSPPYKHHLIENVFMLSSMEDSGMVLREHRRKGKERREDKRDLVSFRFIP